MSSSLRSVALRTVVAIAGTFTMVACSAMRLDQTWVKPNLKIQPLRHVMAVAVTANADRRLAMEDALAMALRSEDVEATPSYATMPDDDIRSEEQLRAHLEVGSYDGAIMLRVTDVTHADVYVPGRTMAVPASYQTLWGYYGYWRPIVDAPGYVEPERDVRVETEVYALPAGDLVYSAVSGTLKSATSKDMAGGVGQVVASDLKAKGLILK